MYDQINPQLQHEIKGHNGTIWSSFIDDNFLVTGGDDQMIKIWNLQNLQIENTFKIQDKVRAVIMIKKIIILGLQNGLILKIDAVTGQLLLKIKAHDNTVTKLILLQDMKLCSSSYQSIKIWNLENLELFQTLEEHDHWVLSLIEIGQGKLASGSADKTIKIWDLQRGVCLNTLSNHSDYITSMVYIDDQTFASGSRDKTIKIWRKEVCVKTLTGGLSQISSLIHLPNGDILGGDETSFKIWDYRKGICLITIESHNHQITNLIQHNNQLISCSYDSSIKIWKI